MGSARLEQLMKNRKELDDTRAAEAEAHQNEKANQSSMLMSLDKAIQALKKAYGSEGSSEGRGKVIPFLQKIREEGEREMGMADKLEEDAKMSYNEQAAKLDQ